MLKNPQTKYRPMPPVGLKDRRWPDQVITRPPIWMSTDLRDGNQALFEPMDGARKMRMFKTICAVGIKQIEVGFPSASQTDFDFVRELIEGGHVPDDVTIEVLTQAREDLIRRTFESLRGARQAIVHVYNATAENFRRIVFNVDEDGCRQIAIDAATLIRQLAAERPETRWTFQYSPEVFSGTELPFALAVCNAVTEVWQPTPDNKVIYNLPATIEMSTPNIYADQIEWMHRNLDRRDSIVLSVHPHNDRGCAIAAAELAVMGGADRIEGCLFGNGERTGNVDLVTLALNLYSQGVDPGLDFSNINAVARTVEDCTQLPIHPRHPYVGDLVFTAFSGSHQDAIKKGFAAQKPTALWEVPYLPLDPADLGRTYDSVIRVNSQSGKGGVAYLLETVYGIVMPRRLQIEFSSVVQNHADRHGGEMGAADLWALFAQTYLQADGRVGYLRHHLYECATGQGVRLTVEVDGITRIVTGEGNGPIDAAVHALRSIGIELQVRAYEERSVGGSADGGDAPACAFVEAVHAGGGRECFGVGIDANIVTASIKALTSAASRMKERAQTALAGEAA